jgi:fatty acid synthase subunit alpha
MGQLAPSVFQWPDQDPRWCLVSECFDDIQHGLISFCSATALQSIEIACDTLLSGKAKVMIAGGFDDISEEGSYEFANMKATSNSETEFAMGREPTEMSRPATTTRAGFMESQGTGVHILMSARTALELGAPIRGIIAFTSTST